MEVSPLLTDPLVQKLSATYEKSPAQLLLKWALSKGFSVLPKSTDEKHIRENVELGNFVISAEDMKAMDGLDKDMKYAWNPKAVV